MPQLKCPFSAPLVKDRAGCSNAHEVIRRGGSEFDCRSEPHHAACARVFEGLKAAALPAFAVEDDLTSMPHSVLVKIQSGGLVGLRRLLQEPEPGGRTGDIGALIERVLQRYGSADAVPFGDVAEDMTAFKLERRARRG